ncbi:unnamed protein product [Malus baccata var. baccata]
MYNHSPINHSQVRHAISLSAAVYLGVNGVPSSSRLDRAPVAVPTARWSSPSFPFLKVKVDASWSALNRQGFIGVVMRGQRAEFVAVYHMS